MILLKCHLMLLVKVIYIKCYFRAKDTADSRKALVNQFALDLLNKHWTGWDVCDEVIIVVFSKDDGIVSI